MNKLKFNEIFSICSSCGEKLLNISGRKANSISTFYEGICHVCLTNTIITEIRDYAYIKKDEWEQLRKQVNVSKKHYESYLYFIHDAYLSNLEKKYKQQYSILEEAKDYLAINILSRNYKNDYDLYCKENYSLIFNKFIDSYIKETKKENT